MLSQYKLTYSIMKKTYQIIAVCALALLPISGVIAGVKNAPEKNTAEQADTQTIQLKIDGMV